MPFVLKLGIPTPGSENDCSGVHFIFEDKILEITPELINITIDANIDDCQSYIEPQEYESMITEDIEEQLKISMQLSHEEQCTDSLVTANTNRELHEIELDSERLKTYGVPLINEWERTDKFKSEWLEEMDPTKIPILQIQTNQYEIQTWFEFINESQPKYRCWLCSEYGEKFKLNKRYRTPISTNDGQYVYDKYKDNYNLITRHYNSKYHKEVIRILAEQTQLSLSNKFVEAQNKIDNDNLILKPTSNFFRTVYTMVRANIPFESIKHLVNLQEIHGVDLGKLYQTNKGVHEMTLTISEVMKNKLIDFLKKNNNPLSLIIDAAEAGYHYLSVMIQTIENNGPIVYFYELIKLTSDESGQGLYNSLIDQLTKDNLLDFIQTNLYGVATDGQSSMISTEVGLVKYLSDFAQQPIYKIHCLSHR